MNTVWSAEHANVQSRAFQVKFNQFSSQTCNTNSKFPSLTVDMLCAVNSSSNAGWRKQLPQQ
jgi:hypothetical protein